MITGLNGAGKTSVLEAVDYLSTLQSFRGSPREAHGAAGGATGPSSGPRPGWTTERSPSRPRSPAAGRSRTMVNRQTVRRRADLHDALRTTVFSPEDIGVVRVGPGRATTIPRRDAGGRGYPRPPGRPRRSRRSSASGPPFFAAAGRRLTRGGGDDARRVGRPARRVGHGAGRGPGGTGRGAVRHSSGRTTRGWPEPRPWSDSSTGGRGRAGCSTRWPQARPEDLVRGVSTVGPHRDELELVAATGCPPAPTPPRGSSARWPSPSGWPPTSWPPSGSARRRCSCSTTSSPSSIRSGRGRCSPGYRRARPSSPRRCRPRPRCRRPRSTGSRPAATLSSCHDGGAGVSSRDAPDAPVRTLGRDALERSLDAVSRGLGLEDSTELGRLFARWDGDRRTGDGRARAAGPARRRGAVVTVDHPAWATQVRHLGDIAARPGRRADRRDETAPAGGPGPPVRGPSFGRRPSARRDTPGGYTGASESGELPQSGECAVRTPDRPGALVPVQSYGR